MSEIQNFTNVLDELETSMKNKINMVMSDLVGNVNIGLNGIVSNVIIQLATNPICLSMSKSSMKNQKNSGVRIVIMLRPR